MIEKNKKSEFDKEKEEFLSNANLRNMIFAIMDNLGWNKSTYVHRGETEPISIDFSKTEIGTNYENIISYENLLDLILMAIIVKDNLDSLSENIQKVNRILIS